MKFRILVAALCLSAVGTGVVLAEGEQVARQQMMKQVGGAMGAMGAIAKGEKPYDAAIVAASLTTLSEIGKSYPSQFPVGSETGYETEASPKIWEDMADFTAKSEKMASDAQALLAQLPADQAAVGQALGTLGDSCSSCHRAYRVK